MTKFKPLAVSPHSHSDASLDGGSTVEQRLKYAAEIGRVADCLTDHGVMSNLLPHYVASQKLKKDGINIKSIHGIEAYIIDPHRPWKQFKNGKSEPKYSHMTIHFKTMEAYKYFCSLSPKMEQRAIVKYGERKPLLTLEDLEPIAGQITIGSGCFVPGTKVQTKQGLKNIEDVSGGEEVLTPEGKWTKVLFPTIRNYKGLMYKIYCDGCLEPFIATPNHEFLKKYETSDSKWVSAEYLKIGDFLRFVVENNEYSRSDNSKYIEIIEKNLEIKQDIYDENFLKIFGFFVANGSIKDIDVVNFIGHTKKDEYFLDLIEKWAINHNAKVLIKFKSDSLKEISIFSKSIFNLFIHLMDSKVESFIKKIPEIYKRMPIKKIRYILMGYFSGNENLNTINSTSYELIDDIASIIRRLGLDYYTYNKPDFFLNDNQEHPKIWSIFLNDLNSYKFRNWLLGKYELKQSSYFYKQINKIEKIYYSGPVHCLSVPESESFTLAGGVIAHNCLIGLIQKNVLRGRLEWAKEMYERIRSLAGPGNFFVELFPHIVDHNWQKAEHDKKTKQILKQGYFKPITKIQKDDFQGNELPEDAGHICNIYCKENYHYDYEDCNGAIDIQKEPNLWVLEMAKKYKDPILMSLDDHFASKEDKIVQDVRLGNGQEKWKFYNSYYMMTSEECAEIFKKQLNVSDRDIEEWIDNSYLFLESFNNYKIETNKDRWLLPTVEMIYNIKKDSEEVLMELIEKHGRMPKDPETKKIYEERINYEINVLKNNGTADFLPYFFVLEDCVDYAKKNNIIWNVRGSAGGSLLLYLLGVSICDPIKYDLPFERFLTLGRIISGSLPDADTDWDDRELILKYIEKKYGDRYSLISTNMLLKLKTSILDVERAKLGAVRLETAIMCKNIPQIPQGVSDKKWLYGYKDEVGEYVQGYWEKEESAELRKYAEENPEIWETVQKCIGITKTKGVHAGGVIISPKPVKDDFPILMTKKGPAVAFDMKMVEMAGGVKYDFLGVSTLKAIGYTLKSIKERFGIDIKWDEFPYDPKVFTEILHKDKLEAIFQLNTKLVRPYVRQIKPNTIEQIAAITALCRPGALDAPCPNPDKPELTAAQYFVKCANGEEQPYYIHPDLEPILKETYGVIVYQEQPLRIYRDLIGYSYAEAEEVRRGIGKKIQEVLAKHGKILKDTLIQKRGWTETQAHTLFETIQASAKYSFNCLGGDTLVVTDKGLIKLSEIVNNYNNYKVLSQTKNGYEFRQVSYGQYMGKKDVYEIELDNGQKIIATPDHMLKSNGEWKTVQEIIDNQLEIDLCEKELITNITKNNN